MINQPIILEILRRRDQSPRGMTWADIAVILYAALIAIGLCLHFLRSIH